MNNNKTALITGINGFIGKHLARKLVATFPDIRIVGIDNRPGQGIYESHPIDMLSQGATTDALKSILPDYIFHFAGITSSDNLHDLYNGNVLTTINIVESVRKGGLPCRIVVPGSAAEYGRIVEKELPVSEDHQANPITPYGLVKLWQTETVKYYANQGVDAVIGRLFNLIAPDVPERFSIGAFACQIKKIRRGEIHNKIQVGNLKPKRDFIDINDACMGFIALAMKGKSGEIYNICSNTSLSVEDVLSMMIESSGVEIDIIADSCRFKAGDIENSYGSNAKIKGDTDWYPKISIEKSISTIFEN